MLPNNVHVRWNEEARYWEVSELVRVWLFPWPKKWIIRYRATSYRDAYEYAEFL